MPFERDPTTPVRGRKLTIPRVSCWKLVTIVSKLVYFTYLRDVNNRSLYRGEITQLHPVPAGHPSGSDVSCVHGPVHLWKLIFLPKISQLEQVSTYTIHNGSLFWNLYFFHTVDGSEIRQTHQLKLVVYAIIYRVSKTFQVVVLDF